MALPRPTEVFGKPVTYEPIFEGIRWNKSTQLYDDVLVPGPIFVNSDGQIVLSAENNVDAYFADYYGEYAPKGHKGYAWVDPKLEKWAKDHGCFWEWRDPGTLILYRV